jgi:RHS repeat-associated protein
VAVSDAAGGAVGRVQYDPYGEVLTSTLPVTLTDRLFTGQRLDSSSGLYYYNARYYDPYLGRFIQPDTLVPDPLNPQAWNRFSYVYNNPTSYVDPGGHIPIDWLLDIGGLAFDIYQLHQDPSLANWGWLALDVGLWVLPFVPAAAGALAHTDEAADLARAAGRMEDVGDAIRYAPPESGHTRRLQAAIRAATEEGTVVAVRPRARGAHLWDNVIEAKRAGEQAIGGKKLPKGLRIVRVEDDIVPRVADLDVAFGINLRGSRPRLMTNDEILEWGWEVNRRYGARVVTHGDLVSGRVFLNAPGAAWVPVDEVVYLYGSRGLITLGPWGELLYSFDLPHRWWRP